MTSFKLDLAEPHIRRFISEMRTYVEDTITSKNRTLASLRQAFINAQAIGDYKSAKEIQLRESMILSDYRYMLFEDETTDNVNKNSNDTNENQGTKESEAKGILATLKSILSFIRKWTLIKPIEFLDKIISGGIKALI